MEEHIIFNPENYQQQYLEHLNQCFSNWGGEKEYEWVFQRRIGDLETDLMVISNDEDGVLAGSAVTYRKLADNHNSFDIGIMTGSWTLPAARRKGCFGKIISASKELCNAKNVEYLTAFVTETNPSCRGLKSAGSYMFPSFHLFSPETKFDGIEENIKECSKNVELFQAVYERMTTTQEGLLNFSYTYEEFVTQYVERIKETKILQWKNDFVIIEEGKNEVKILLMTFTTIDNLKQQMKSLTNWCLSNFGRKTFFYTTRKDAADAFSEIGFENVPGFFTILKSDDNEELSDKVFEKLNINMADKM